ncbi:MAG: hypothetical protein KDD33_03565, partial [Bdellovibrionales bacterium]|nr:hypothetical protein [Bdellovibrionales bacterium]
LDEKAQVVVQYDWSNPFHPSMDKSYALPKDFAFNQLKATGPDFDSVKIESGAGKVFATSLTDLKVRSLVQRTQFLMKWKNEVMGNTWSEQLLAWGAFASLVDRLDRAFDNPELELGELEKDPIFQSIQSQIDFNEVRAWLKNSKLFSPEELADFEKEISLNTWKGRKWFITASLVTFAVVYMKSQGVKGQQLATAMGKKLHQFLKKAVTLLGAQNTKMGKFLVEDWGTALRSRMTRNYLEKMHPVDLIKKSEKRVVQFEKLRAKLYQTEMVRLDEIGNGFMKERAKTLLEAWDEIGAKLRGDKLELQEIVAPKGLQKYHGYLKRWVDKYSFTHAGKQRYLANLYNKIAKDADKLKVLEESVQIEQSIMGIKGKVLQMEMRVNGEHAGRVDTTKEMVYLKGGDPALVTDRIAELLKKANAAQKARLKAWQTQFEGFHKRWLELEDIKGQWIVKGKVHPFFDYMAAFSTLHTRYMIPARVFNRISETNPKVGNFISRFLRHDQVVLRDGRIEDIVATGEHAQTAFYTGLADVSGDMITQYLARQWLVDPDERVWGQGDNFLEFFPTSEGMKGVHFDFIAQTSLNAVGWAFGGPMTYANMGKDIGFNGKITYLRRIWNSVFKSFNPANIVYGLSETYPIWLGTKYLMLWDYKNDHAEDFNEKDYQAFADKFGGRTTSIKSIVERKVFGYGISIPYINSQYFMQSEADRAMAVIFRTNTLSKIVAGLVMPITTGFYMHKWWGDYFGFNNPETIRVLQAFQAEGVLDKIDSRGFTDLKEWTEVELQGVLTAVLLLEMEKFNKEKPFPKNDGLAEQALWYAELQERMLPDKVVEKSLEAPTRIQVMPGQDVPYRYKEEVKDLLATLNKVSEAVTEIDVEVEGIKPWAFVKSKKEESTSHIAKLESLHERVLESLSLMKANSQVQDSFQTSNFAIIMADATVLVDSLFLKNKLSGGLAKAAGQWSARAKVWLKRASTTGLIGSVPMYLWQSDQANAHTSMQVDVNTLLVDLNELLFAMTEIQIKKQFEDFWQRDVQSKVASYGELVEYKAKLQSSKDMLAKMLTDTKASSEHLLTARRYRWAIIYDEFAIPGMAAMASWILTRHLLFKASRGFITRMTDAYAPTLFKGSFLAWIVAGEFHERQRQDIELTTGDFLSMYQSYQMISMELAFIEQVTAGVKEGNDNVDWAKIRQQSLDNLKEDTLNKEMKDYREHLLKVIQGAA